MHINNNNCSNGKIVIAIDFWLYAHKFLHSTRSDNILIGFFNQILKFLSHGIIPIYVIDGQIPFEKFDKTEERSKRRNNTLKRIDELNQLIDEYVNIDDLINDDELSNLGKIYEHKEKLQNSVKRIHKSDLTNIRELFDIFGIHYVRANFEADALCVKLYKEKLITSCLSDDMDMLAFGCGSTIKFNEGKIIEFNLDNIKMMLNLSQDQFIDLCIMFGTDYLKHPFRLDCEEIYKMIHDNGSLLEALVCGNHESFNMNHPNVRVLGESYQLVKNVYLNSCDRENIPDELFNISINLIDFEKLIQFLKKMDWFDQSHKNIKKIKDDIHHINEIISK
jgi:5'-3' exonuclease